MRWLAMVMTVFPILALAANAGPPLACNMLALTKEQRVEHAELAKELFASVLEQKEMPNGYAFRLPPDRWLDTARWADLERRCCPFFAFEMTSAADGGALWLRVTGGRGVKAFMKEELGL